MPPSTKALPNDPVIAFQLKGPPYHESVVCLDCGVAGFDEPLKRSEVIQERCDCGSGLEDAYERIAMKIERERRGTSMSEDEKRDLGYHNTRSIFVIGGFSMPERHNPDNDQSEPRVE